MKCPSCGFSDSRVLDSRPTEEGNSIRRRRECAECGKRFTTYEVIETTPITVIKKDGSREYFDRNKLEAGIMHACQKRPVDVGALVSTIEKELQNALITEVATEKIGEMVMAHLRKLDAVSYVRFASVYREFKDADTFLEEINKVIRGDKKEKKGKC
ncbi:MAG: transcriptional repressor NrdR [Ruminococcaceae bacterium]|nr:transcriptional repressor NrdR [Oscillospiraceae bacterium]